jgi:DNA polymerase alpha subunit A
VMETAVPAVGDGDVYADPPPRVGGGAEGAGRYAEAVPRSAKDVLAKAAEREKEKDGGVKGGKEDEKRAKLGDEEAEERSGDEGEDVVMKDHDAHADVEVEAKAEVTARQRAEASAAVAAATARSNVSMGTVRPGAPLARDENGDLLLFWTDATEMRINGGEVLYLFGKAEVERAGSGVFASVCVVVQGVERALYVLPRAGMDPVKDVYGEVSERLRGKGANSNNMPTAFRAKPVERMCPFGDVDAPRGATRYLKVKFPFAKANALGPDAAGRTFKRVYGMKTTASEMLCLKRGLKGPGWLRIKGCVPSQAKVSHARHTLTVAEPGLISVAEDLADRPSPPLSKLCISTKTVLNERTGVHELVMLSGVFVPQVPLDCALDPQALDVGSPGTRDFVLMYIPEGKPAPLGFQDRARASAVARGGSIEILPNESVLLNNFTAKLIQLDPDALLGHDMLGFGLELLLARMAARRTRKWSCLGRLVQSRDLSSVVKNNASTSWFKAEAVAGRLVADTYAAAKEILYKEKDYSLAALSANVLGLTPADPAFLPPATDVLKVPPAFNDTNKLGKLVKECTAEARMAGRLSARLSILPLSKQLTCISGNLWSRTLQGARAQRIEFLLCHEFLKVGSKKAGLHAQAGNTTCKLLLPDKLTKAERGKIEAMINARYIRGKGDSASPGGGRKVATPVKPEASAVGGSGFGGGEDATPAPRPRGGSAGGGNGDNGAATTDAKAGKSTRRKPQYSGGLVLEPKKGLYDRYVLQLDFNSLYPSIIQEFNICFTTLELASGAGAADAAGGCSPAGRRTEDDVDDDGGLESKTPGTDGEPPGTTMYDLLPDKSVGVGVLPRVLRELVSTRRKVKMQLKNESNPVLRSQLDIRQTAIKLTANSLYGCLGFEASRFYAQSLAALVTFQGRDTLQSTVQLARDEFNAEVIYGDTDSLFVYTGLDDIKRVRELGYTLKKSVNARYKTLEIEIDAIYSKMLLLKKKKYAALKVVNPMCPEIVEREVKGLDLVRHDWCDLSHDASEHFLAQIFAATSSNVDDAVGNVLTYLEGLAHNVRNNEIDYSKYVITKSLTKDPSQYADGLGLPHVQVALRLRRNGHRVQSGDYIKYIVCRQEYVDPSKDPNVKSSSNSGIAAHAYHPDEVEKSAGKLQIDAEYYLENQVLPPVMRLCDPVEQIESSRLASSLGLDSRKYSRREAVENELQSLSDLEMFHDVVPLAVTCASCHTAADFRGAVYKGAKQLVSNGLNCPECKCRYTEANIANSITFHVRKLISQYYTAPYRMNRDDGTRERVTRNIALGGHAALVSREYDEAWLYTQMRYVRHLMDVEKRWEMACGDGIVSGGKKLGGGGGGGRSTGGKRNGPERNPLSIGDFAVYRALYGRANDVLEMNGYKNYNFDMTLLTLGVPLVSFSDA